jgi:hypothetical protein
MPHILRAGEIEVTVQFPTEGYNFTRFDWTGKIKSVRIGDIQLAGMESLDRESKNQIGVGFCNEFGIQSPCGFDETAVGGWFHKIGVGLLCKTEKPYDFFEAYKVKPAEFKVALQKERLHMTCISDLVGGYGYELKKSITVHETGFRIDYCLRNYGAKVIVTDEYVHNFICIHDDPIGANYHLKFPFNLYQHNFNEIVNPMGKVFIQGSEVNFMSQPDDPFFFSNLTGDQNEPATWSLRNDHHQIELRETGNFTTNKINLWGRGHVISPELFYQIHLLPDQEVRWSRAYEVTRFELSKLTN